MINKSNTELEGDKFWCTRWAIHAAWIEEVKTLLKHYAMKLRGTEHTAPHILNLNSELGKRSVSRSATEQSLVHAQFRSRMLF